MQLFQCNHGINNVLAAFNVISQRRSRTRQPENHQFLLDALSGYQSTLKNLKFIDAYKNNFALLPLNLEITITTYNLNLISASMLERADFQEYKPICKLENGNKQVKSKHTLKYIPSELCM